MTEKVEQAFHQLEWHDAVLLKMCIDRRTPGERDEVSIFVQWTNGRTREVRFVDCYALDAAMNFGVIAPESIRSGRCVSASPRLVAIREKWKPIGVDLEALRGFEIVTNSTNSQLLIVARSFCLEEVEDASVLGNSS